MTPRVEDVTARACFAFCRAIGFFIRSARYSSAGFLVRNGQPYVRKWRAFYARPLISLGDVLMRVLNSGVRVLHQREWEERERHIYASVYGRPVAIVGDGAILLPVFAGRTLAALLQDPQVADALHKKAIRAAVFALAAFHRLGITHADAMADNVLVDLNVGMARWFDFETVHDPRRPLVWRRADDVRALLATCLMRTVPERRAEVLELILDCYGDKEISRAVASNFDSAWQRARPFHLAQADVSFESFRAIAGWMRDRSYTEDRCPEIGFEPGCC